MCIRSERGFKSKQLSFGPKYFLYYENDIFNI